MRKRRNVVVLGLSMVGKTAICMRFAADRFSERYEPTFQTSFHKLIRQRSDEIELFITDTQGQDDQENFRKEYCLGAHGYVFVYSITSVKSLEACVALNSKLTSLMGASNVPRVLVGRLE
jgi:small GTP-binding protein